MPILPLEALDFRTIIRPGDVVAWGQAGAEPTALVRRLMDARQSLGSFSAFIGICASDAVGAQQGDHVAFRSYIASGKGRELAGAGLLDIYPVHYSTLAEAVGPVDVLLLQVAQHPVTGKLSLSVAHEYLVQMLPGARLVVAQINALAPWSYGDGELDPSDIDYAVRYDELPATMPQPAIDTVDRRIAAHVAGLIENASTLQIGVGALPEAILSGLRDHGDIGIHSGAIGDAVADLTEAGVITNARKAVDAGITVAGILLGGARVYAFADRNPDVVLRSTAYTHSRDVIARLDRFVAINSALEVDLSGQINTETAGGRYLGGVGGAVDFMRGAAASRGGQAITVLRSVGGARLASRIVPALRSPASVARSDAGIIVTEFGIADLRGCSIRERRRRLLDIAHPDHRAALDEQV